MRGQTVGRFMTSPFPGAEAIMHDAGGCELFGAALKFHSGFPSGDLRGSGRLSSVAAAWAGIISHSRRYEGGKTHAGDPVVLSRAVLPLLQRQGRRDLGQQELPTRCSASQV